MGLFLGNSMMEASGSAVTQTIVRYWMGSCSWNFPSFCLLDAGITCGSGSLVQTGREERRNGVGKCLITTNKKKGWFWSWCDFDLSHKFLPSAWKFYSWKHQNVEETREFLGNVPRMGQKHSSAVPSHPQGTKGGHQRERPGVWRGSRSGNSVGCTGGVGVKEEHRQTWNGTLLLSHASIHNIPTRK